LKNKRVGLGVRFDSGSYKIEETGLEMKFKSFHNNENKGKGNCVALKLNPFSKLKMQKIYCEELVHSLCQFKQNCKSFIQGIYLI
jgi:hypothetical protein